MQQAKIEKVLTNLLKMALHRSVFTDVEWSSLTDEDWKDCYSLAVKHGVMAVAFDGVQLLPIECQPCRPIRLSWAVAVKNYEERYERYCRTAAELSALYAGHGIAMVQLKGVGLSSYYPVPSHREGGDIDIYTYSLDTSKMSDSDANKLADKLMEDRGVAVEYENEKHSNVNYKRIPIENHKTFLDMNVNKVAHQMDILLKRLLEPRKVYLCNSQYEIWVPSPEFNVLFLSCHAGRHYCEGLRLHHIYDWACMLKKYGLLISKDVKDKKLLRFIYSLTEICNILFETNVSFAGDASLSREVYGQIMHPKYEGNCPKSKLGIFFYKIARVFYVHRMQSKIYDRSLWGILWHSFVFHLKNPKTIFSKR